jgi:hypothetical protein
MKGHGLLLWRGVILDGSVQVSFQCLIDRPGDGAGTAPHRRRLPIGLDQRPAHFELQINSIVLSSLS